MTRLTAPTGPTTWWGPELMRHLPTSPTLPTLPPAPISPPAPAAPPWPSRPRLRAVAAALLLPLAWLGGTLAGAAPLGPGAPPLTGSPCAPAALVDAGFRDAALAALGRLAVQAPGRSAHGAVRSHHSAGHVDSHGRAWHQISAYQVNLGLVGALRVSPKALPLAANWLRWLAGHIAPGGASRGVVLDHWVRADDFAESTCPPGMATGQCGAVDAYDSTAATTLLLAEAYLARGGDVMLIRDPAMRQALEAAATTLNALGGPDGLTIAKPDHAVVYTMDIVEVVAGWRAWARLQRDAYAQPASAVNSDALADRAEASLHQRLWLASANAWAVSLGSGAPQPGHWYPDTVAQAWPLLWGVGGVAPERARATWRAAIAPWQRGPLSGVTPVNTSLATSPTTGPATAQHWARSTADPAGFWWPAVAVAAACTGDEHSARTWVARARARWLDPKAPFAWPFQVGDLLWLLWLADPQPALQQRSAADLPALAVLNVNNEE